MEKTSLNRFSTCENSTTSEYKNSIIIILLSLVILSILGVNVFGIGAGVVDFITDIFSPILRNVLDMFGYSLGAAIRSAADQATDGAKFGVEVVGGSVKDAGQIVMQQTKKEHFDNFLNSAPEILSNPSYESASSHIQSVSRK